MQTFSQTPVSIPALLTRQLADWQQLLAQLKSQHAPASQLDYCQAQIDRLQDELTTLQN